MRRFDSGEEYNDEINHFFDDEDFDDDDDDEDFDEDGIMYDNYDYIKDPNLLAIVQTSLATLEINGKTMESAIKVAEKTLFWRFYSIKRKLNLIADIYQQLDKLIDTQ